MISSPTPDALARAAQLLRAGKLVAFPTETVYGLGADADNERAVRAIFAAKGRPADHPVIVHVQGCGRRGALGARDARRRARPRRRVLAGPAHDHRAARAACPGCGDRRPGQRGPARAFASGGAGALRAFAAEGGRGIAAPSANRFGRISPTTAQHVRDDLGDDVAMIVDGGACDVGIESTIVAFGGTTPSCCGRAAIAEADLARVLGARRERRAADAPRASGTLASHYAPRTPSRLVSAARAAPRSAHAAVLARTVARRKRRRGSRRRATPTATRTTCMRTCARSTRWARRDPDRGVPASAEWNAVATASCARRTASTTIATKATTESLVMLRSRPRAGLVQGLPHRSRGVRGRRARPRACDARRRDDRAADGGWRRRHARRRARRRRRARHAPARGSERRGRRSHARRVRRHRRQPRR